MVSKSDRMENAAGYGVAATAASLAYAPFKLAYAAGGATTGALAWLFSGGDVALAQRVIEPAVCGEYVIPKEALLTPRRVEFIGSCSDDEAASGLAYTSNSLPAVSAGPPLGSCQTGVDAWVVFDYDRAELDARAKADLDALAQALTRCGALRLHVEGHADSSGTGELNMALSKRRAAAVRSYLLAQGVAPERVTTAGYGVARNGDAPDSSSANDQTTASRRMHTRLRSY